ncbi:MAG: hypothetical protein C4534_06540 [Gaiellales bacterium]|nr:MAG: hypothetical protein C4534_06540 [Gaiellales bacterium]
MHLKFTAEVKSYGVKEVKDAGNVAIITLATPLTHSLNQIAMMVGSEITIEVDHFVWEHKRVEQGSMDQALSEPCAACGHTRQQHKLDPNLCLGEDGACTCDEFISAEQAEKGDTGETAEVAEEKTPEPDAICSFCGHIYSEHVTDACSVMLTPAEGEELEEGLEELQCPCPGFMVQDPDLEGEDYPDDLTCTCGHPRASHDRQKGCMISTITGEEESLGEITNATCRCIRVFTEDGTPDGIVGDHDDDSDALAGGCMDDPEQYSLNDPEQPAEAAAAAEDDADPFGGELCSTCGHPKAKHRPAFGCEDTYAPGLVCTCMVTYDAPATEKKPTSEDLWNSLPSASEQVAGVEEPKRRGRKKTEAA